MRQHRLLQGYKISFPITDGDCSRDEDAGSETEEMAKSEVAGVKRSLTHHHRTSATMN